MSMKRAIHIKFNDEELSHLLSPPIIDDSMARKASDAASSRVARMRLPPRRNPLALAWEDCCIQRIMGVGGYGAVSLVRVSKLDNRLQESNWYALKCLRKNVYDRDKFIRAVSDLYKEAAILTRLQHKNIVQIHGLLKQEGLKSFQEPGGYFIVMQCMKQTLDALIYKIWPRQDELPSLEDRISKVVQGISDGMKYLHDNRIIYRDLKPDNVGIDYSGNVRLLDFGTAVELEIGKESEFGCVGSLAYMAPEVLMQRTSYLSSDVYSFAILLFQIISLKRPYGEEENQWSFSQYKLNVGTFCVRPSIPKEIEISLKDLLLACWHQNYKHRPTFATISQTVQQMVSKTRNLPTVAVSKNDHSISKLRRFFSQAHSFRGHSRHRIM